MDRERERELNRDRDGGPLHLRITVTATALRTPNVKLRHYAIDEINDYASGSYELRPCPGLFCGRMPIYEDDSSNETSKN